MTTKKPDRAAKIAVWWNELSYDDWYPQKLERRIRRAIADAVKEAVANDRAAIVKVSERMNYPQTIRLILRRADKSIKKGAK